MTTRRTQRLNNLIQTELGALLQKKVKDPRLALVTITSVDVSPDLSQAKVFYSLLEATRRPEVEDAIKAATQFLRRELAGRLQTKMIPRLLPLYDPSLAQGAHIDALIRRARQEDQAQALARGEQAEPSSGEDQS